MATLSEPPRAAETAAGEDAEAPRAHSRGRLLAIIAVAALIVVAGAVVGIRGLLANPVVSTSPDGTATLSGSFARIDCSTGCLQGYIQAGARSVFIRFPDGCAAPAHESVTVTGLPAPDLGKAAYRATTCP